MDGDGKHGRAGLEREPAEAALRPGQRSGPVPGALGEDADRAAALEDLAGGDQGLLVGLAAAHRVGAEPVEDPALPALLEELDLGDVVEGPAPRQRGADHERVEEAAVVGRDDQRALDLAVLAPDAREPEVEEEEGDEDQAREEVERAVDAVLTREAVVAEQPLLVHAPQIETPARAGSYRRARLPVGYQAASRIAARSSRVDLARRHVLQLGRAMATSRTSSRSRARSAPSSLSRR